MRTIIAGSRDITNYDLVKNAIAVFPWNISMVLSGGARGVDKLGERWATENKILCSIYRADWDKQGKKAGILRNIKMAENADALIAIWDGESRGTKHMIQEAFKKGLVVFVYMETK